MKAMAENQDVKIAKMSKDIEYIRYAFDKSIEDNKGAHEDIMKAIDAGLKLKVSISRYKIVEMMAYALAGSTLVWALNQILHTIEITKALL